MDLTDMVVTIYDNVNSSSNDEVSDNEIFRSKLTPIEDYITGTYLLTVCLLALTLNSLVIYTCLHNWKHLTMSDFYILNLACSDVILPLCAFPLPISSSFSHRWIYGRIGCAIYGFLGFFFGIVSISTLTTMGITRYISVCHYVTSVSNKSFTKNAIISAYIYALLWSAIPFTGWGSYSSETYGTSCTLQWNENRVFITMMALFCICSPSVVMLFSYIMIVLKCRQSHRSVRERQSRKKKLSRRDSYLIKITFAMCWGFLVSWMPYAVVSLWTAYGKIQYLPMRLTVVAVLLAKSSTVVNPVIYFLLSNKFRPLLRQTLNINRV